MFKKIIIFLLAVIVGLALFINSRPDDFRITRTIRIPAQPDAIFPHVNSLHAWDAWSPWAKLDPNATNSFAGPENGVGSSMSWSGNDEVGVGTMTITESRPSDFVQLRLDFLKPFAATNTAEFTFKVEGNETVVSWTMFGKNNFISKAAYLVMNCDKMVGDQFEKGLGQLKGVVVGR